LPGCLTGSSIFLSASADNLFSSSSVNFGRSMRPSIPPRRLGSPLTAVQSLCDEREQFRRHGEPVEDYELIVNGKAVAQKKILAELIDKKEVLVQNHASEKPHLFTDSPSPAMWWRRPGKQNRMSVTASMRSELPSIRR
jgi:hypothetical protein